MYILVVLTFPYKALIQLSSHTIKLRCVILCRQPLKAVPETTVTKCIVPKPLFSSTQFSWLFLNAHN